MCGCWGLIGVTLGVAAEQRGVYDRVMSHKNPQQSQFTIRKTTKHPSYAVKCILFHLFITAQFTVQSMAHGATVHIVASVSSTRCALIFFLQAKYFS